MEERSPIEAAESSHGEHRIAMSYGDYLVWHDQDGRRGEWVAGEVIVFMPPKTVHQEVLSFLNRLLGFYVTLFRLGRVLIAPFEMRLTPEGPAREPDLLFLGREPLERLTPERLLGPADLVVEIISDESAARDRTDKFYEYQAAGVREYWIIDPRPHRQRVDLYTLLADGRYQALLPDQQGWYHSPILPGFRLKSDWLWQANQLDPLDALVEMRGLTPEVAGSIRALLTQE